MSSGKIKAWEQKAVDLSRTYHKLSSHLVAAPDMAAIQNAHAEVLSHLRKLPGGHKSYGDIYRALLTA